MLEFIHYLSHHKLRTALTVLAIAVGVFGETWQTRKHTLGIRMQR